MTAENLVIPENLEAVKNDLQSAKVIKAVKPVKKLSEATGQAHTPRALSIPNQASENTEDVNKITPYYAIGGYKRSFADSMILHFQKLGKRSLKIKQNQRLGNLLKPQMQKLLPTQKMFKLQEVYSTLQKMQNTDS